MISRDGNRTHQKTRSELLDALQRQLRNMERSFAAFDDGATEEAERIASGVYILCHDGVGSSKSKSLLGLLNFKAGLRLPDTMSLRSTERGVVTMGPPLLAIWGPDTEMCYRAPLALRADIMARRPFSKWWDDIVFETEQGQKLSRKNLIFRVRTHDGGAHVDDNIKDSTYLNFVQTGNHVSYNEARTLAVFSAGGNVSVKDAHLHSVRQIGCELITAIDEDLRIAQALADQKTS